jgi:putative ABC transport system permease protein
MKWLHWTGTRNRERELDEEIEVDFALEVQQRMEAGANREEAESGARRDFGNVTRVKEVTREMWGWRSLEWLWQDVRFGVRSMYRANLAFVSVAVLTLALGIGATTAMFSVIDNVLLEPFPYVHQERLYSVVIHDQASSEPGGRPVFPAVEFLDYQQQNRVFDDVMGVAINRALWDTGGAPESVNAPLVTPNAFQFLGVPAMMGRIAAPSDVTPGAPAVCVMSYSFWKSRFAGDHHILGKILELDGTPRTVIGVMPPRFVFWSADVWIPVTLEPTQRAGFPPPWFYMLGRLKQGMTPGAADRALQILAERLAKKYWPDLYPSRFDVGLQSFAEASIGKFRRTLFALLAAVGLLLAIACANVANLLLARAGARKRELAVRTSLGAGWWRIVRQLFCEGGLLAILGAAAGCAFAWGGLKALVAILPQDTFPDEAVISLNLRVLAGTVAVTIATAIFFGLIPIMTGLRRDINEALKSGGREHSAFRRSGLGNLLVVGEVAISLVLLAGAGLMMRSFLLERQIPLGLSPEHVLSAEVFPTKGHGTVDEQARYRREFTEALRRLPGVMNVATTSDFLPFGGAITEFELPDGTHTEQSRGQVSMIDPNLFRALNIRLLEGRNLTEADIVGKHMVAVVNQAFATRFFPGQSAVGERVQINTLAHLPQPLMHPSFEIIGVTSDFKNRGVRESVVPEAFVPYSISGLGSFSVFVRTLGNPKTLGKTLEATALRLDASTVVRHIRTVQESLENLEYAKPRFALRIFSAFSALALILVCAGLYSVMSYTVSQRKREMGIRMALGATTGNVQVTVIRAGLRFVAMGIVAGLFGCFGAFRLIRSQLWGVNAYDPTTILCVIAVLLLVGVAASYAPSVAATHADPADTLRAE